MVTEKVGSSFTTSAGGCHRVAHLRERRGKERVMRVVGPRDPREGLSGFGELLGAVEGATEVIPEAFGVARLFRQAQTRGIGEGLRTI